VRAGARSSSRLASRCIAKVILTCGVSGPDSEPVGRHNRLQSLNFLAAQWPLTEPIDHAAFPLPQKKIERELSQLDPHAVLAGNASCWCLSEQIDYEGWKQIPDRQNCGARN
jgi:hypothetical protein